MKAIQEFTVEEVCMWLVAIGLGSKQDPFKDNAVDGKLLVELSDDDMKNDLSLSNLQVKKVRTSIEFCKDLQTTDGGSSSNEVVKLQQELEACQKENEALKREIQNLKNPTPTPAPVPQQAPAPAPKKPAGHPVIKETGKGALKGATLGAVAGAIAGDVSRLYTSVRCFALRQEYILRGKSLLTLCSSKSSCHLCISRRRVLRWVPRLERQGAL